MPLSCGSTRLKISQSARGQLEATGCSKVCINAITSDDVPFNFARHNINLFVYPKRSWCTQPYNANGLRLNQTSILYAAIAISGLEPYGMRPEEDPKYISLLNKKELMVLFQLFRPGLVFSSHKDHHLADRYVLN